ncbi:RluA family pseudouridine synthase [Psychrobium sp. 1_MG-2023]|uniref:RluA family pseudouridine synthase n=1 Tax=Psychrobium sp. 1_MG-2023 TaxID=3062624 RepID=UPI000C345BBD|nr:RluA family pseudouridine synthase [Psychrobium sp. 1_MG-2023]MDP2562242.1 pseudouridine synthase [Psychrobium sp. 1_MG-2023]PKF57494.1 RNA pseudouridine synthase [Alteromonadales bacterium alter-6D02]
MTNKTSCFTPFAEPIDSYELPERFTFPFFYQPHPLSLVAVKQLQQHLQTQQQWQHDFNTTGKMFGVLIVRNSHGELGFLSAYSGKVANSNSLPYFVPPVFNMLDETCFFIDDTNEINTINQQVKAANANPDLALLTAKLAEQNKQYQQALDSHRQLMTDNRAQRKAQRQQAEHTLLNQSITAAQFDTLLKQLGQQSVNDKNQLRDLKLHWQRVTAETEQQLNGLAQQLASLKEQRKEKSAQLQQKLFAQYRFLNIKGELRDLNDIFSDTPVKIPPAGAGECAAPKLLHYAFANNMQPLAMAEFWWGSSPKSEVRQHQQYYPACQGKCQPILGHMLNGMNVDDNPLLTNPGLSKEIDILFQDEHMLVINKPAGLLSVPGKTITDSVQQRLKQRFPYASGPLIVHRLDMATSGLMLIALTKRANKSLQRQFIHRGIKKHYIAILAGELKQTHGEINLPMRGDLDDRPRQLVCEEHGKPAKTTWRVLATKDGKTKVSLSPETGRTHQLRVHCAHHLGLNTPIVGDSLYGVCADRLHLHAKSIHFQHPISREVMSFSAEEPF